MSEPQNTTPGLDVGTPETSTYYDVFPDGSWKERTKTTKLTEKKLLLHGWIRGKRKDGGVDWLYPGYMQPCTFDQACEITLDAYRELYGRAG